jgi:hypothetical protein
LREEIPKGKRNTLSTSRKFESFLFSLSVSKDV